MAPGYPFLALVCWHFATPHLFGTVFFLPAGGVLAGMIVGGWRAAEKRLRQSEDRFHLLSSMTRRKQQTTIGLRRAMTVPWPCHPGGSYD
jgi:hypothetical protein